MSRIGRVITFIAASVVSGLALAFIIVAWRPQLVGVVPAPAPPAAEGRAPRDPEIGDKTDAGPTSVEKSGAARQSSAGLATDGQPRIRQCPGARPPHSGKVRWPTAQHPVPRTRCLVIRGCGPARRTRGRQYLHFPDGDRTRAAQWLRGVFRRSGAPLPQSHRT